MYELMGHGITKDKGQITKDKRQISAKIKPNFVQN